MVPRLSTSVVSRVLAHGYTLQEPWEACPGRGEEGHTGSCVSRVGPALGEASWEEVSATKRELRTARGQWGGHPVSSQDLFLMSNGWKITLDPFLKGGEGVDQFTEGRGFPAPGNASTALFSNRIKAKASFEPLAAWGC